MLESEIITFIRREIARQAGVILSGSSAASSGQREDIQALYPGMPTITDRPVMHPYGYVSRPPSGVIQVVGRQGATPENRIILGHRDANRPPLGVGCSILYNQFGQQVRLENGTIKLGGADSNQPIVLGSELKSLLTELIAAVGDLAAATNDLAGAVVTAFGNVAPLNPITMPALLDAITAAGGEASAAGGAAESAGNNFVANDAILSNESFARKGG